MNDISIDGTARKKFLKEKMISRSQRLTKLIELDAPSVVIGKEVLLVVEVGLQIYGQRFFFEHIAGELLAEASKAEGVCTQCISKNKVNPNRALEDHELCHSCLNALGIGLPISN